MTFDDLIPNKFYTTQSKSHQDCFFHLKSINSRSLHVHSYWYGIGELRKNPDLEIDKHMIKESELRELTYEEMERYYHDHITIKDSINTLLTKIDEIK